MPVRSITQVLLMIAILAVAGCAGSREAASPAAGAWSYSITTPDGVYDGTLALAEANGALGGTLVSEAEGNQAFELENVAFEDPVLTFQIDHPQYGMLDVEASVEGDAISGTVNVPGYGKMPLQGTRQAAE